MANKRLNATITIGGVLSGSLRTATGSAKRELQSLGNTVRDMERQQRKLGDAIQTFGRQGKAVDGMKARYALLTTEIERQRRALERLQRVESARERNMEMRGRMKGGLQDSIMLGAAVALPVGASMKKAADFDYQLQVIGNTANMTDQQVRALGDNVLRLSRETGQAATGLRDGIGFLIAAGADIGTAQALMRPIGRTATATASAIEDVARASFTLNDALKINPAQMQDALAILVQAGKEGNFEFKAMAENLPVLGASFVALKMEGREAVATMGAALQIARKGAKNEEEAANNMRNFLAKILSPDTLKKASKLGVDLNAIVTGAQKRGENPFEAAIRAIDKMTKGGDQKLIGDLFQDMQVQNFIRPMLQNLKEYERIKRAALDSDAGLVDADFAKMMATNKQQMTEMANAAERLAIVYGQQLAPAIGKASAVIVPMLNRMGEFVQRNPTLVQNVTLLVGGLVGLRIAAFAVGYAWTFVAGAAIRLWAVGVRLAPVFLFLGRTVLPLVGKALLFISRALLLNPIGLAVTAIAGAAFLVYKNWEPLSAFFGNLWADITDTFNKSIDWVVRKVQWVGDTWGRIKSSLGIGDAPSATPSSSPTPPSMPMMMRAAGNTTDARQYNFEIKTLPGQSNTDIANEVMRQLDARQGVRQRGLLFDGAGG